MSYNGNFSSANTHDQHYDLPTLLYPPTSSFPVPLSHPTNEGTTLEQLPAHIHPQGDAPYSPRSSESGQVVDFNQSSQEPNYPPNPARRHSNWGRGNDGPSASSFEPPQERNGTYDQRNNESRQYLPPSIRSSISHGYAGESVYNSDSVAPSSGLPGTAVEEINPPFSNVPRDIGSDFYNSSIRRNPSTRAHTSENIVQGFPGEPLRVDDASIGPNTLPLVDMPSAYVPTQAIMKFPEQDVPKMHSGGGSIGGHQARLTTTSMSMPSPATEEVLNKPNLTMPSASELPTTGEYIQGHNRSSTIASSTYPLLNPTTPMFGLSITLPHEETVHHRGPSSSNGHIVQEIGVAGRSDLADTGAQTPTEEHIARPHMPIEFPNSVHRSNGVDQNIPLKSIVAVPDAHVHAGPEEIHKPQDQRERDHIEDSRNGALANTGSANAGSTCPPDKKRHQPPNRKQKRRPLTQGKVDNDADNDGAGKCCIIV